MLVERSKAYILLLLLCLQEKVFELGDRLEVLSQLEKPAIIPHMADFEGKRFPYEVASC